VQVTIAIGRKYTDTNFFTNFYNVEFISSL
jgi:hypothetical protein